VDFGLAQVIHRPTAFILGAGTSVPYGFPSGKELLRMARGFDVANLKDKAHARAPADVEELHAALQRTHDSSLDTLLELRSDIAPIGKRLIASLILELEFHSTFPQRYPMPKDDWLTRFFGEVTSDTKCLEDFAKGLSVPPPGAAREGRWRRQLCCMVQGALVEPVGPGSVNLQ